MPAILTTVINHCRSYNHSPHRIERSYFTYMYRRTLQTTPPLYIKAVVILYDNWFLNVNIACTFCRIVAYRLNGWVTTPAIVTVRYS